nr:glutamate cyclase domain-containing protein [Clostridium butyricum]
MNQEELTIFNIGENLDSLMNLDPRGYGVCRILYSAAREYTGEPLSTNSAKKLVDTLKDGDMVYIMTGFVLRPFKKAEMDGIVSAMLLARALVKGFGVKQ